MDEKQTRNQRYKCLKHDIPLKEIRGVYYCDECLFEEHGPTSWDEKGTTPPENY